MEQLITLGIAVVGLIVVLWILVKIVKAIKPMSKEEAIQHEINKRADQPTHQAGGSTGCRWIFIAVIIFALAFIALILGGSSIFD